MKRLQLAAALALFALPIYSQTLNFTLEGSSTDGRTVVPRLTWTSAPAGAACTASAVPAVTDWTGSKLSSGTQVLPATGTTTTYTQACVWGGNPTFSVSWEAPTMNNDGTPYTNPGGFRVLYGRTPDNLDQSAYIQNPGMRIWTSPTGLTAGNWYVSVLAYNALGLEGPPAASRLNPKVTSTAATRTVPLQLAIKFPGAPSVE